MANSLPDLECLRRSKGLTLDQIAQQTKISLRYLQAIEEGRVSRLPGGVYNNSYLRQYARAIDYDENELVAFYSTAGLTTPTADNRGAQLAWKVAWRAWATRRR